MDNQALITLLNHEMETGLPEGIPFTGIREKLQAIIHDLIATNFDRLIHILYRVDVNERKLKYLLQENIGEEAAVIIADLIIARQLEKIASRDNFNRPYDANSEEEQW